jgi:hypothetical protein
VKTTHWTDRGAEISSDGLYRYRLWRARGRMGNTMLFVMLNPSTADGKLDDATIRRCLFFAERQDAVRIEVVNLYAYRSTAPKQLRGVRDPVGPSNDAVIAQLADEADVVVFAWGGFKAPRKEQRVREVVFHVRDRAHVRPVCFGLTEDGSPKHPLYQPNVQPLVEWQAPIGSLALPLPESRK